MQNTKSLTAMNKLIKTRTELQGTETHDTMSDPKPIKVMARKLPIEKHISSSITDKSFENLFRILPTGVTSKKRLIGACSTIAIYLLWIFCTTVRKDQTKVVTRKITMSPVAIESEKMIVA